MVVVEQVIRPTGLLDPVIEIRPSLNQIDDLIEEIHVVKLTKEFSNYSNQKNGRGISQISYKGYYSLSLHSLGYRYLERIEIMQDLRKGRFDVLIGVNLLREGLVTRSIACTF
jgi:excinuclease ABC subunit B